jgi:hypothetical protein
MVPLATYLPHGQPSLLAQLALARHHDDSQRQQSIRAVCGGRRERITNEQPHRRRISQPVFESDCR